MPLGYASPTLLLWFPSFLEQEPSNINNLQWSQGTIVNTLPYWHIWCSSDGGREPVEADVEVDVDHVEADVEGGGDGAWGDTGDAGLASLRIRTAAHDKSAWVARAQPKQDSETMLIKCLHRILHK